MSNIDFDAVYDALDDAIHELGEIREKLTVKSDKVFVQELIKKVDSLQLDISTME